VRVARYSHNGAYEPPACQCRASLGDMRTTGTWPVRPLSDHQSQVRSVVRWNLPYEHVTVICASCCWSSTSPSIHCFLLQFISDYYHREKSTIQLNMTSKGFLYPDQSSAFAMLIVIVDVPRYAEKLHLQYSDMRLNACKCQFLALN
jgi:hypothetical protein